MSSSKNEQTTQAGILFSCFLLLLELSYWITKYVTLTGKTIDMDFVINISNVYSSSPEMFKCFTLLLMLMSMAPARSKSITTKWRTLILVLLVGLLLFWSPFLCRDVNYIPICCGLLLVGYVILIIDFLFIGYKLGQLKNNTVNNKFNTFPQETKKIVNDDSINIPIKYVWNNRVYNGWINWVAPFRGSLILGTPGSGKTFAVILTAIHQLMEKDFCFFVYDYKYPSMTNDVYREYRRRYGRKYEEQQKMIQEGKFIPAEELVPHFCVINFNDPRYSMRCNPIHPDYIKDIIDANEIAEIIMNNVGGEMKDDFWRKSAIAYLGILIWILKTYKNGIYCTVAHLVEFLNRDYKVIFETAQMQKMPDGSPTPWIECMSLIELFSDSAKNQVYETLTGQISSARVPLAVFTSPVLYWIMSGDDFKLDINNPEDPKIICVGNDPDRESVYGTNLALILSRTLKLVNHKGKRRCAIVLDEMPTMKIKNVEKVIATARENKVAIIMGAQDKSQFIRDYNEKEAEVIFNVCGNYLCGQVNGSTARDFSNMFGKQYREKISETTGGENTTQNSSYQLEEILPAYTIENLSTGTFFGRTQDVFSTKIENKLFCGEIVVSKDEIKKRNDKSFPLERQDKGAFKDEQIVKKIMENKDEYCINYLCDKINSEDQKAFDKDITHTYTRKSASRIKDLAKAEYAKYDEHRRKKLLDECVDQAVNNEIRRVIYDNYYTIQKQIDEFFIDVGKPEGVKNEVESF